MNKRKMNLINFIPPKRYTDNQQSEAIGIMIKKINEMIVVINQMNSTRFNSIDEAEQWLFDNNKTKF